MGKSTTTRQNTGNACTACRRARRKCQSQGSEPCVRCTELRVECIFKPGEDGRSRPGRRFGQHKGEAFNTLIEYLRQGDRNAVDSFLDQLRGLEAREAEDLCTNISKQLALTPGAKPVVSPGATTHFGNLPLSSAIKVNGYSLPIQRAQLEYLSQPRWKCLPLMNEGETPDMLSQLVLSFRKTAQAMIANGIPADKVLCNDGLAVDLLFRDRRPDDLHTVSTFACELNKSYRPQSLVVQLGSVQAVGSFMRWLIAPSPETYASIPDYCRPLPSQLLIPHSIGIDLILFPEARESLITLRRDWVSNVTANTARYNWPYSDEECTTVTFEHHADGPKPSIRLSKAFRDHMQDSQHFSIDVAMLREFPEFEGKIRLHDADGKPMNRGQHPTATDDINVELRDGENETPSVTSGSDG